MRSPACLSLLLLVADPVVAEPLAASASNGFNSALWPLLDVMSTVLGIVGFLYLAILVYRALTDDRDIEKLFIELPMVMVIGFGLQIVRIFIDRPAQNEANAPGLFSQLVEWVGNHWSGLALGAGGIATAAGVAHMAFRLHNRRAMSRKARRQVREVLNALDIVEHYRMYWVGTSPVDDAVKRLRLSRIESLDVAKDQLLNLLEHTHNGVILDDEMLKNFKHVQNDVEKKAIDGIGTRVVWPPGGEADNGSDEGHADAKCGAFLIQKRPDRTGQHGIDWVSRAPTQSDQNGAGGLSLAAVGLVVAAAPVQQTDFTPGDSGCRASDDGGRNVISGGDSFGCAGNESDSNYQ